MIFRTEQMQSILPILQKELQSKTNISFCVLNPDLGTSYAGTKVNIDNITYIHRGYKAWVDLAELLKCKMLTPKISDYPLVTLTFEKLIIDSFHSDTKSIEKYGSNSHFSKIYKMEEPAFFYYYNQALDNVKIAEKTRILNLGINRGDEFDVIKQKLDTHTYETIDFVGIDHSQTAIASARELFSHKNFTFYTEDLNQIDTLKLEPFDLLISIGTLQSPSINFKPFFMKLVQEYLTKDAAIILGFPNSRWVGGELLYGAKVPNYAMSELGHMFSDVMFCKKYLQQKKYRVTITGKQYIFLTATKIN